MEENMILLNFPEHNESKKCLQFIVEIVCHSKIMLVFFLINHNLLAGIFYF